MTLTEKEKTAFTIVGFFAVLGLVGVGYTKYFFVNAAITQAKKKEQAAEKDIEALKQNKKQIEGWLGRKDEMEAVRAEIRKVTRRLPESPDAPGFLNALVATLRATGIIQQSVRPKGNLPRSQYTEIPYTIAAYGRYHELGQFLTLIEQNPDRFMRLKNLTLTNNLARPSVHPIDMQIETFMFGTAPASRGKSGPAKGGAKSPPPPPQGRK